MRLAWFRLPLPWHLHVHNVHMGGMGLFLLDQMKCAVGGANLILEHGKRGIGRERRRSGCATVHIYFTNETRGMSQDRRGIMAQRSENRGRIMM